MTAYVRGIPLGTWANHITNGLMCKDVNCSRINNLYKIIVCHFYIFSLSRIIPFYFICGDLKNTGLSALLLKTSKLYHEVPNTLPYKRFLPYKLFSISCDYIATFTSLLEAHLEQKT